MSHHMKTLFLSLLEEENCFKIAIECLCLLHFEYISAYQWQICLLQIEFQQFIYLHPPPPPPPPQHLHFFPFFFDKWVLVLRFSRGCHNHQAFSAYCVNPCNLNYFSFNK